MAFDNPKPGETKTTCPYCGVGCGVVVQSNEGAGGVTVRGDEAHPSNFGRLCSKGSALGETLSLEERLLFPVIGEKRATWDNAIELVASTFSKVAERHGPEAIGFYLSGQLLTEDYYVANKLMKGFIGSSNIDTNSRLCMASSVAGYKRAFGSDTVPNCYEDLEQADLVVLVGSNFAWCHPVLHQRLLAEKAKRATRLVVIDPRRTATCESADLHLALRPGTDVALFNGLFAFLAQSTAKDDAFIQKHTERFDEALQGAGSASLKEAASRTGLSVGEIQAFYELFRDTPKALTIFSQGVNQSSVGTDKVNAIINCHLVTGRIGKPGSGPFSITGQPNAMGGREVGGLANQLAAHMDFDEIARDRIQRFWDAPNIVRGPGLKAVEFFDRVLDGSLKAVWIMATNPAVSMPNANRVKQALEQCDFVVVSDIVKTSDTVRLAHVKLPATGWGEKSGTVTNSERRISRQRSFLEAPGEARHDWRIVCDVAKAMGFGGFDYRGPGDIYREHASLSAFENEGTRDFDIGAYADVSDEHYDRMAPFQWPAPSLSAPSGDEMGGPDKRFFADGRFYTETGRARFIATPDGVEANSTSERFPMLLNTGRIRDQWHTMTRTGKSPRLSEHITQPFIEVHPADASALVLDEGGLARISNDFGSAVLRVHVSDRVNPGDVFSPIHWSDRYASSARVSTLAGSIFDPISGQPELKRSPVAVEAIRAQFWGFGVYADEPFPERVPDLIYWAKSRLGDGWALDFAANEVACQNQLAQGLIRAEDCSESLSVTDLPLGCLRRASFKQDVLKSCLIISTGVPVVADRNWMGEKIGRALTDAERLILLAGRPPNGQSPGRMICSCMGVGANAISDSVLKGARSIGDVGEMTLAGTNCGSCKSEIGELIRITTQSLTGSKQMKNEAAHD